VAAGGGAQLGLPRGTYSASPPRHGVRTRHRVGSGRRRAARRAADDLRVRASGAVRHRARVVEPCPGSGAAAREGAAPAIAYQASLDAHQKRTCDPCQT
jgi:hypothetical protein